MPAAAAWLQALENLEAPVIREPPSLDNEDVGFRFYGVSWLTYPRSRVSMGSRFDVWYMMEATWILVDFFVNTVGKYMVYQMDPMGMLKTYYNYL